MTAAVDEGHAQHGFGVLGAQGREQGVARQHAGVGQGGDAPRPPTAADPFGLAIDRAEGHRDDRALGQGLAAAVADHRPARRLEVDLPDPPETARAAVGQPQDRPAVGALQRSRHEQAAGGALQHGGDRPAPGGFRLLAGEGVEVGECWQMVQFVHDDQVTVPPDLGEVQVGCRGDGLVGGHVALQAPAQVRSVVGAAHRDGVPDGAAPRRIGERLLRLQTQALARHDPAHPVNNAGRDQASGGNDGKQALAAAGRHGGQDVADRRLAGGDGADDSVERLLVGSQLSDHV